MPRRSCSVLDAELVREALVKVVVFEVAFFVEHSHFGRYLLLPSTCKLEVPVTVICLCRECEMSSASAKRIMHIVIRVSRMSRGGTLWRLPMVVV